jgi:O-antigen ligase
MWSELGLLGMFAFAALMAILLWKGWRGFTRATGFYRAVLWGTSAAFVALLVHGIFDTPYFKNDLSLEFWTVAALEVAALALAAKSMRETTREPAIQR